MKKTNQALKVQVPNNLLETQKSSLRNKENKKIKNPKSQKISHLQSYHLNNLQIKIKKIPKKIKKANPNHQKKKKTLTKN